MNPPGIPIESDNNSWLHTTSQGVCNRQHQTCQVYCTLWGDTSQRSRIRIHATVRPGAFAEGYKRGT